MGKIEHYQVRWDEDFLKTRYNKNMRNKIQPTGNEMKKISIVCAIFILLLSACGSDMVINVRTSGRNGS